MLDLAHNEDSAAGADANFILTAGGGIVEIQARQGMAELSAAQKKALG